MPSIDLLRLLAEQAQLALVQEPYQKYSEWLE
jgi:hypothetical protein